MPGITKNQLHETGKSVADYTWCRSCKLYWRKRGSRTHRHPDKKIVGKQPAGEQRELDAATKEFLDYLIDEAIGWWLAQERARDAVRR